MVVLASLQPQMGEAMIAARFEGMTVQICVVE